MIRHKNLWTGLGLLVFTGFIACLSSLISHPSPLGLFFLGIGVGSYAMGMSLIIIFIVEDFLKK